MSRPKISKDVRKIVYDKYNGHCAYCGCKLEYKDMQVDHMEAVYRAEINGRQANDSIDNYMPACRMCNFYKSTYPIDFITRGDCDKISKGQEWTDEETGNTYQYDGYSFEDECYDEVFHCFEPQAVEKGR